MSGQTALQRMPRSPYSIAIDRVSASRPALAALYGATPGAALWASVEATLTIARSPLAVQHRPQRGAGDEEGAAQVDRQLLVPALAP